jgi:hypothetical protein
MATRFLMIQINGLVTRWSAQRVEVDLTTSGGAAARSGGGETSGGGECGQTAKLRGQTLGVLVSEIEDHRVPGDLVVADGVLGNHTVFIFDFDGDPVIGEQGMRLFKNGGHFAGLDAVVIVAPHPDLELAEGDVAEGSAAIEEGLPDAADFRDVERLGNGGSVGQADLEVAAAVAGEEIIEFA